MNYRQAVAQVAEYRAVLKLKDMGLGRELLSVNAGYISGARADMHSFLAFVSSHSQSGVQWKPPTLNEALQAFVEMETRE